MVYHFCRISNLIGDSILCWLLSNALSKHIFRAWSSQSQNQEVGQDFAPRPLLLQKIWVFQASNTAQSQDLSPLSLWEGHEKRREFIYAWIVQICWDEPMSGKGGVPSGSQSSWKVVSCGQVQNQILSLLPRQGLPVRLRRLLLFRSLSWRPQRQIGSSDCQQSRLQAFQEGLV